jgi:hypothetical protein
VTNAYVLSAWQAALQGRRFTVLLVHTASLKAPDALDWFLDSLDLAKGEGRIRLLHSSAEAFTR